MGEDVLIGRGAFTLKSSDYLECRLTLPCRTGQWSALRGVKDMPFKAGDDVSNLKVNGLGAFRDGKYWRLEGKRLAFRPVKPGVQQPAFEVRYHEHHVRCRTTVKVELTELPVEIDWDKTRKRSGKTYVPFVVSIPEGFELPFSWKADPKGCVMIDRSPDRAGRGYKVKGYVNAEEMPADTHEIVLDLTDPTDAVAQAVIQTESACECQNPPARVMQVIRKFKDPSFVAAAAAQVQGGGEGAVAQSESMLADTLTFSKWIGGLTKCKQHQQQGPRVSQADRRTPGTRRAAETHEG